MILHDRTHAAFLLAEDMGKYRNGNGVVMAIPRGGVPVGYHLAHQLHLPMDIIVSKKIPHPDNPEFAIGAVCGQEVVLDERQAVLGRYLKSEISRLTREVANRYRGLAGDRAPISVQGRPVILTDDGMATGYTMEACVAFLKLQHPSQIVVAVPVTSTVAKRRLTPIVDDFVAILEAREFRAVSEFYERFPQVDDEEVKRLMEKAELEYAARVEPSLIA